jgi:catechol 2,3-dioxygenase-like lactoylglutathione lyase family enzyme
MAQEAMVNLRYMTLDVEESIAFYTTHLGFELESNYAPAFGSVTLGSLRLLLSGPSSSGARPMPDGSAPVPGGWNRVQVWVEDIDAAVARLEAAGMHFRGEIVRGVGGSQAILDDPSGNPIELWQNRNGG